MNLSSLDKLYKHYSPKKPNTYSVKSMVIKIRSVFAWGRGELGLQKNRSGYSRTLIGVMFSQVY